MNPKFGAFCATFAFSAFACHTTWGQEAVAEVEVVDPQPIPSQVLKTDVSPTVSSMTRPDLAAMEAKRIDVPKLESIPESDLPKLLRSENAEVEKHEPGMLEGLLKRDAAVTESTESEISPEPVAMAPVETPVVPAAPSVDTSTTEAIEKVRKAETQAASFTAALALALGGEENLPEYAQQPATPALPVANESMPGPPGPLVLPQHNESVTDASIPPATEEPGMVATSSEPLPESGGPAKKLGGIFSGIGNVLNRGQDEEPAPIQPVATPAIEAPVAEMPAEMPVATVVETETPPAPPAPVVEAPPTAEEVFENADSSDGILSGIGGLLKRDKKQPAAIEGDNGMQEPAESQKRGMLSGLFSSEEKEPEATVVPLEDPSSVEEQPEKKLKFPSFFKKDSNAPSE